MEKIRTILIGAGRMGRNHLRVLSEDRRFQVVGVVDPAVNDLFPNPVPYSLAKSLDELGAVEWDCAVVAAPSGYHAEIARRLLAMRKPFLMEKPLASTPAECQEVVELAKTAGVRAAVGHLERFNPAVRKLAEVMRSGWLGRPIHFSFTRVGGYPEGIRPGDNVLLDLAVHDLDVLRFLVGPVHVVASVAHGTWKSGVLDTGEIMLRAERGQSASIHVNWVTPSKIRSLRVTGTQGVCFVDYILQSCVLQGGNLLRRTYHPEFDFQSLIEEYKATDRIEFGINKQEPLKVQLGELYKLLAGEPSEICSLEDAAAAVTLADDAIRSAVRTMHSTPPEPMPAEPGAAADHVSDARS
jgi:UDP-N-acetylglucosamine 3-dehydrogenase